MSPPSASDENLVLPLRSLSCCFLSFYMSLYHFYFTTYCDTKPFQSQCLRF